MCSENFFWSESGLFCPKSKLHMSSMVSISKPSSSNTLPFVAFCTASVASFAVIRLGIIWPFNRFVLLPFKAISTKYCVTASPERAVAFYDIRASLFTFFSVNNGSQKQRFQID